MRDKAISKDNSIAGDVAAGDEKDAARADSVRAEQADDTQQSKGDVATASSMKPNAALDSGAESKRESDTEGDLLPVKKSQDN